MRIGLDVGRSAVKGSTLTDRLLGLPVLAELPADGEWRARGALDRLTRTNGTVHLESWRFAYQGRDWLVGERVETLGIPGARYAMTVSKADPSTVLLILAGVTALAQTATSIEVCVGIPMAQFESEGAILRELLRGEHKVKLRGVERSITMLGSVVPEGLGIWVRSVTPDLSRTPNEALMRQMTVILDVGFRTVQGSIFHGLRVHPKKFVSHHGTSELWTTALIQLLETRGGTVYEPPQRAAMMTRLIREGVLNVRGRRVTLADVEPLLIAEAEKMWPRLEEELKSMLEGIAYERVVAGGGGVRFYATPLKALFGEQLCLIEDRFAQAEGYRLYLEHGNLLKSAG